MNLVNYCKEKEPKYYDELKVGDEIMFINCEDNRSNERMFLQLYDMSYNKLYKIIKISNSNRCNASVECTTDYICIAILGNIRNKNIEFFTCGFVLANRYGETLKSRKNK